jgi:lipid II:glycine glycyltransferase (peptidoglycan interpeptide bridge formation enzyme)
MFANKNLCDIFLAKLGDRYISAAFVNYHNDTAFYSHGGSLPDSTLQKFGASYLLHAEMIRYFNERGFKKYNMWGGLPDIDDAVNFNKIDFSKHALKGVSDFKKKFGGELVEFAGGFEIYRNYFWKVITLIYDFWVYRNDRI